MRSEKEIRQKLNEVEDRRIELIIDGGDSPVKPDGSADPLHLAAISAQGEKSMLEWVLGDTDVYKED